MYASHKDHTRHLSDYLVQRFTPAATLSFALFTHTQVSHFSRTYYTFSTFLRAPCNASNAVHHAHQSVTLLTPECTVFTCSSVTLVVLTRVTRPGVTLLTRFQYILTRPV